MKEIYHKVLKYEL